VSGRGLHVLLEATLRRAYKRPGLEVYPRGRYFIVTGNHLPGTPETIEARQEQLDAVIAKNFGAQQERGEERADDPLTEGERNNRLTTLAGKLRRIGLAADAIAAALQVENQGRCDPPLDDREVERIARSVGRYPAAEKTEQKRSAIVLVNDVELLSRPRPRELIAGRMVAGGFGAAFAPPGACKTFAFVLLAVCVARRHPWLGADVVEGGPIIYVAAEGGAGIVERIRAAKVAVGAPLDVVAGVYVIPQAINLMDPASVGALLEATATLGPVVYIFDTQARCMPGGDENSARDMGLLIAGCDYIRQQTGAAVWPLHHSTKTGSGERGSSALRGAVDTLLSLDRLDDLLTLRCEKQKDSEPFEPINLRLVPVPETNSCTLRLATDVLPSSELTPTQVRLLVALRSTFLSDGATMAEWRATLPDVPERTFYRARKLLVEQGYVRPSGQRFVVTSRKEAVCGDE
jgi:hypothetical protein